MLWTSRVNFENKVVEEPNVEARGRLLSSATSEKNASGSTYFNKLLADTPSGTTWSIPNTNIYHS